LPGTNHVSAFSAFSLRFAGTNILLFMPPCQKSTHMNVLGVVELTWKLNDVQGANDFFFTECMGIRVYIYILNIF
jgi:hypothetical protein